MSDVVIWAVTLVTGLAIGYVLGSAPCMAKCCRDARQREQP